MEKELNINGNIYRLVEDNKLEVGKWYLLNRDNKCLCLYTGIGNGGCGLDNGGYKWCSDIFMDLECSEEWQPANTQEVEKLLFKEAEKRGLKDGIKYKGMTIAKIHVVKLPLHTNEYHLFDDKGNVLFDFKSGQWAEIIEEKPLYTNSYGEEFFKGDNYITYSISKKSLTSSSHHLMSGSGFSEKDSFEETEGTSPRFKSMVNAAKWIVENYD